MWWLGLLGLMLVACGSAAGAESQTGAAVSDWETIDDCVSESIENLPTEIAPQSFTKLFELRRICERYLSVQELPDNVAWVVELLLERDATRTTADNAAEAVYNRICRRVPNRNDCD